jgi:hypothetical protein
VPILNRRAGVLFVHRWVGWSHTGSGLGDYVQMTDAARPTNGFLAGYRVVRKLATGSRADVYLGAGSTGTVAIKAFRPDVSRDSIGVELDALSRLDSPHFVRLVDLSTDADDVPVLILERVRRGSVVTLLRDRDSLERGEVVTLLAPIAAALPGLHRLGVGHGNIGATTLHVGAAGEPVLLGFGHCELFARDGSIAAIEAEPTAASDRDALAALAIVLLSRIRDGATDRRTVGLIEWIDASPREFEFAERLESRLFDFADPVPIEFGRESAVASVVPARIGMTGRVPSILRRTPVIEPAVDHPAERPDGIRGWLGSFLLENPLESIKTRLLAAAKSVRKPFWVMAGAVALAFVIVIAALPQGSDHPAAASTPRATHTQVAPSASKTPLPTDPVLALPILLAARTNCIRDLSVLCLNDVDEPSSSAYSDDAALIEQLQGGSEIPKSAIIAAPSTGLIEMLGDSAIVSLGPSGNPASVLMIRDEAGWRIRGYLSGIQSTGTSTQQP